MRRKGLAACVAALALGVIGSAVAVGQTTVTLTDRNSIVDVDLTGGGGMNLWEVDSVGHLFQQWFWYRIGPAGGESSLESLGLVGYKLTDGDWDPGNEILSALYGNRDGGLSVELGLMLAGGNPGSYWSDIAETITFSNKGATALEVHFFQYCDLDLGDTAEDASVWITGENTAHQRDESFYVSETVATGTPYPDHRQVDFFNNTLASLTDGNPTLLGDAVGPIGPGNLTWAFEWDFILAPGASYIISKDKQVPEPATLCLLAGGLGVLSRRRFRLR